MDEAFVATGPILRALAVTVCSATACAILQAAGAGPQASLFGGLIVAGGLNILGLVSLNRDGVVPTSGQAVGESGP